MACSRLPREFSSLLLKEELNLAKVMKREDSSMHILSKQSCTNFQLVFPGRLSSLLLAPLLLLHTYVLLYHTFNEGRSSLQLETAFGSKARPPCCFF